MQKNQKKDIKLPQFKERFSEKQLKEYQNNLHKAEYLDFTDINELNIFQFQENTVFFYGNHIPEEKVLLDKMYLKFIFEMEKLIKKEGHYQLIYFNTQASNNELQYLVKFYKSVPIIYYNELVNLVIVHPSMSTKSFLFFQMGKKLTSRLNYINSLEELKEQYEIDLLQLSENILKYEERKQGNKSTQQQENSPQRVSLEVTGIGLDSMILDDNKEPKILNMLYDYFYQDNKHLKIQGIMRKTTSILEDNEIENQLKKGQFNCIFECQNPLLIANQIKKILFTMPEPLFKYSEYEYIKNSNEQDQDKLKEMLKFIIDEQEKERQIVLQKLMKFLRTIAEFQEFNSMTEYNLAVCIMPTILKPEKFDITDFSKQKYLVKVSQILIEEYEYIFQGILKENSSNSEIKITSAEKPYQISQIIDEDEENNNQNNIKEQKNDNKIVISQATTNIPATSVNLTQISNFQVSEQGNLNQQIQNTEKYHKSSSQDDQFQQKQQLLSMKSDQLQVNNNKNNLKKQLSRSFNNQEIKDVFGVCSVSQAIILKSRNSSQRSSQENQISTTLQGSNEKQNNNNNDN